MVYPKLFWNFKFRNLNQHGTSQLLKQNAICLIVYNVSLCFRIPCNIVSHSTPCLQINHHIKSSVHWKQYCQYFYPWSFWHSTSLFGQHLYYKGPRHQPHGQQLCSHGMFWTHNGRYRQLSEEPGVARTKTTILVARTLPTLPVNEQINW